MTLRRVLAAVAALALAVTASPATAQAPLPVQVSSGVEPVEVTVGDPFRSVIRVDAPAGVVVEFPEHLGATEAYQSLGPVEVLPGDEGDPHIAVYPLVAWQTGDLVQPVVPVFLRLADGTEQILRVTLPMPTVNSVLPADTAGVQPRAAKPIIDEARAFPWWLVIALLLALVLLALIVWLRRRQPTAIQAPPRSPRAQVIAELEELRAAGLIERRQWRPYFSRLSDALRRYLESLSPRWTSSLTTGELLEAMHREGMPLDRALQLEELLRQADLVKFARAESHVHDAEAAWVEARRLVDALAEGESRTLVESGAGQ
jgi:hypothetical protein